jgi:hypothetical protein
VEIRILKPGECQAREIEAFCELVAMGEQVPLRGLPRRVRSAYLLAFAYDADRLVAVTAVKNPANSYRDGVFKKAGVFNLAGNYPYEIGYAFTIEGYRGRGLHQGLLNGLIIKIGFQNCYATTKAENVPYVLEKLLFTKTGSDYKNEDGETLKLFTYSRK